MEGNGQDLEPSQTQTVKKVPAPKFPCLRCKKNVTKNSKSVKCNTCQFWVHVECEGISVELFNILAHPEKYGGTGFSWNCGSCLASAARLEVVVKAFEGRIQQVETRMEKTDGAVKDLDKKVESLSDKLSRRDENIDRRVKQAESSVLDEVREREARRTNVVVHKLKEMEDERATGKERQEWDRTGCVKIFDALKLSLKNEDIKFCRRLGEKKSEPRPLIIGFYSEADKALLLRNAKNLENTQYKYVNICPDMTARQRKEEADMKLEADERNENLTEEDRAKNLQWAVVGARGERRLIKTTAREQWRKDQSGRGANFTQRGSGAVRGMGRGTRGSGRGARGGWTGGRSSPPARQREEELESEEEEDMEEVEAPTARGNNKRRNEEEEEGRPPLKR